MGNHKMFAEMAGTILRKINPKTQLKPVNYMD